MCSWAIFIVCDLLVDIADSRCFADQNQNKKIYKKIDL
jgi:hypothetical protein